MENPQDILNSDETISILESYNKEVINIFTVMKRELEESASTKFEGIDEAISIYISRHAVNDPRFFERILERSGKEKFHEELNYRLDDFLDNYRNFATILVTLCNTTFFDSQQGRMLIISALYIANFGFQAEPLQLAKVFES